MTTSCRCGTVMRRGWRLNGRWDGRWRHSRCRSSRRDLRRRRVVRQSPPPGWRCPSSVDPEDRRRWHRPAGEPCCPWSSSRPVLHCPSRHVVPHPCRRATAHLCSSLSGSTPEHTCLSVTWLQAYYRVVRINGTTADTTLDFLLVNAYGAMCKILWFLAHYRKQSMRRC